MKTYIVSKINAVTGQAKYYDSMCEDDMKLTVRGYKQFDLDPELYMRGNSNWYFIVHQIPDC